MTYTWSVSPNFGSISSGQGSNAITVNATSNIGTGYTMSVTASNGCGISPVRAISNLKIVAGSSALELANTPEVQTEKVAFVEEEMSLFPNPASDMITLQVNNTLIGQEYIVFDAIGKVIYKNRIQSTSELIQLENFNNGYYFVKVNEVVKRFVVQH
jgi:hypothetical protein